MKVVSVYCKKGGVNKTTLSRFVGEALTYCGEDVKVLLIDNDHQRNLSKAALGKRDYEKLSADANLFNVFQGQSIAENLLSTGYPNLHLVPGSEALKDPKYQKLDVFEKCLKPFSPRGEFEGEYDYIIIDNNPNDGVGANASLLPADFILIPWQNETFSFDGVASAWRMINERFPKKLGAMRIISSGVNMNGSTKSYKEAVGELPFKDALVDRVIPFAYPMRNALSDEHSIFLKKIGGNKVANAYIEIVCEIFGYEEEKVWKRIVKIKDEIKKENIGKLKAGRLRKEPQHA